MIKGIIALFLYIICTIVTYFIIQHDNHKFLRKYKVNPSINYKRKITYKSIILICIIFTFLNIILTNLSSQYGYDRSNYLVEFETGRSTTSISLDFIFYIFKSLGLTVNYVFYFTTFICTFFIMYSYRISKNNDYKTYVIIILLGIIFYTFTIIKQAFAFSIGTLFFVVYFQDNTFKGSALCFILALLACTFHITGLILFPILLFKHFKFTNKSFIFCVIVVVLIFIFLKPIMYLIGHILKYISISYSNKIFSYLNNSGDYNFSFVKYLFFYYITIIGFLYRKRLVKIIPNYNKYLFLSLLSSLIILSSFQVYWFIRFNLLFTFVVFKFYLLISNNLENQLDKNINHIIVLGLSFIMVSREIVLLFVNYGCL